MARWNDLFADMEAQWESAQQQRLDAEIAEATRLERSQLRFTDRLRASRGAVLQLQLRGGLHISGRLSAVGSNWLSLHSAQSSSLIPAMAVVWVDGLQPQAMSESSRVRRSLGITAPLRVLLRDRARVEVICEQDTVAVGLLGAVGHDHIDLRVGEQDASQRRGRSRTVPLAALTILRSQKF